MPITLSKEFLDLLHEIVLENDPETASGYMYEGMVQGSIDRAMRRIYRKEPFPSILDKAAALLFSIAYFHPFSDGNKRTALLATYFFLAFNGFNFSLTVDAIKFLIRIGDGQIKSETIVMNWLKKHTQKNYLARLFMRLTGLATKDIVITPNMAERKFMSGSSVMDIAIHLLEFSRKLWPTKK